MGFWTKGPAQGNFLAYLPDPIFTDRFEGGAQREYTDLFNPASANPWVDGGDFRQASYTGKLDPGNQMEARLNPMSFETSPQARPMFLQQTRPILPDGSAAITFGVVNAWGSVKDNPSSWQADTGNGAKVVG